MVLPQGRRASPVNCGKVKVKRPHKCICCLELFQAIAEIQCFLRLYSSFKCFAQNANCVDKLAKVLVLHIKGEGAKQVIMR